MSIPTDEEIESEISRGSWATVGAKIAYRQMLATQSVACELKELRSKVFKSPTAMDAVEMNFFRPAAGSVPTGESVAAKLAAEMRNGTATFVSKKPSGIDELE